MCVRLVVAWNIWTYVGMLYEEYKSEIAFSGFSDLSNQIGREVHLITYAATEKQQCINYVMR